MTWRRSTSRPAALIIALAWAGVGYSADLKPLVADVTVNSERFGELILMWDGEDEYYVPAPHLARWRVKRPWPEAVTIRDREWFAVTALAGARAELDARTLVLKISVPPELLKGYAVKLDRRGAPAPTSGTGIYVDYDLSLTDEADIGKTWAGLLSPTLFTPLGALRGTAVYRRGEGAFQDGQSTNGWVRLDTTLVHDDPARMMSWRAGDVITTPGAMAGSVRMAGIQIASNYGTRPGFISFPLPSMAGQAAVPSVIDLYVNGVLAHQQSAAPGQFRIDHIPVVSGDGDLQVIVRDALGREQIYTESFYATDELLAPGLHEFDYSAGWLRRNYGIESNDYGALAGVAVHRYGVTPWLTLGARLEGGEDFGSGGLSADLQMPFGGVLSAGYRASSGRGSGEAWHLGYRFRSRGFSISLQGIKRSQNFISVASLYANASPDLQLAMTLGVSRGRGGAYSAAFVRQTFYDQRTRDILSLSHSRTLPYGWAMSLFASLTREIDMSYSAGLMLSKAFGGRYSGSILATMEDDRPRLKVESQGSPPVGSGIGYRVASTFAESNDFEADLTGQTQKARYHLESRKVGDGFSWRASTDGSIAWMGGRPYFAREIRDGFAIAKVGEYEGVRVYHENQEIGRTDSGGRILLPGLRPYQANRVSIAAEDLPIDARVERTSMAVAPYQYSGAAANFDVAPLRSALMRLVLDDGTPVPEGALAMHATSGKDYVVGMDGLTYVTDLEGRMELQVAWAGRNCTATVSETPADVPLPRLGDVLCSELRQ